MKKSLLSVIVLVVLLLGTGCGKEKRIIPPPAEKTIYDLAKYLFPDKNQTNNYMDNIIIDHSGKGIYTGESNTAYYPMRYIATDTSIKALNSDNNIDVEYVLNDESIRRISTDINYTIIREVKRAQTIIEGSKKSGEEDDPIYAERTLRCILDLHMDEKEILSKKYTDVLIIKCNEQEKKILTDGTEKLTTISNHEITSYYARSEGMIYTIKKGCKDYIIENDSPYKKECEKTVTELMYSIKN